MLESVGRWYALHRLKGWLKARGFSRAERNAMIQALKNFFHLSLIPSGVITLAGGWAGLFDTTLVPFLCWIGHPIPHIPCPENASQAFLMAVVSIVGIGLGRRTK